MVLLSLAVLLAPALALIVFFGLKKNFVVSGNKTLFIAYASGLLLTFPVKYIQALLYPAGISKLASEPVKEQLLFSFIIIALIEEGSKFLLLKTYLLKKQDNYTSIQSITIALLMAMGFATSENIQTAYQNGLSSYSQLILLSVIAHAAYSIIMANFIDNKKGATGNMIAFILPVIFHGLFIFTLLLKANPGNSGAVNKGLFFNTVIIIYLIGIILFYRQASKSNNLSLNKS